MIRPELRSSARKGLPSFLQSYTVGMITGGLERHLRLINSWALTVVLSGGVWSNSGGLEVTAKQNEKKKKSFLDNFGGKPSPRVWPKGA